MRYKQQTTNSGEIIVPDEQLSKNASNDMLVFTSMLGIVIGIIFVFAGRKGKQMWIWVWGIGLVAVSTYLGLSVGLGVKLFTHF